MVASRLGWDVSDSDAEILRATGKSVARLHAEIGADSMHRLEAAHLMFATGRPGPNVICAAASVVENERCRSAMASAEVATVWLRATAETLASRFRSSDHRPEFGEDPLTFLDEQLTIRESLFASVSRLVIDVDNRTVEDVADEVLSYGARRTLFPRPPAFDLDHQRPTEEGPDENQEAQDDHVADRRLERDS